MYIHTHAHAHTHTHAHTLATILRVIKISPVISKRQSRREGKGREGRGGHDNYSINIKLNMYVDVSEINVYIHAAK